MNGVLALASIVMLVLLFLKVPSLFRCSAAQPFTLYSIPA